ncbi:hypothetical protein GCM10018980_33230 [Streptomyces capoamus]|uniref:Uncharacterized protein n=1 Tax=Streptomyces capoamus TaxID=68183 RepID=A0A919C4I1_9ACTN|nr:hypothetical protein GCM10018980_33230 [Streptomyces capoamus]
MSGSVVSVVSRRTRREEVTDDTRPARGETCGTVHAVLGPRGLVAVGGLVEPARWVGSTQPPGRGGTVRLTRQAGADVWDARPLGEPGEAGGAA